MQHTIGIAISKDTLDIRRQPDGRHARFGNDEATGRCHRDMEAAPDAAGHALVKMQPGRARRFAQVAGYAAQTDRADAAMLARLGAVP
ncbi:MAG: hypothetical protein ACK4S2_05860 [Gemmobacter sp.]|uniref:hypothetical protein n=1 Tax=Gemmobacter sp. TaxID=1898957 RepID=UPI0039197C9D